MKKSKRNGIKIASVYIGTVLGAGFASGQELTKFFAAYGKGGMIGLFVAGVLFALIGWAVLETIYVEKIKSYEEYIDLLMGKYLSRFMKVLVSAFMFICFCTMFAGSGALLQQRFNLPYQTGVLMMAIACYITFLYDVKGVIAVNTILAPLLIIGIFILGINILLFREVDVMTTTLKQAFNIINDNWVTSTIVYVSYNSITAVVVLTSLYSLVNSKAVARGSSILAGVSLSVLGLCLGVATLINYGKIKEVEIPMLEIVMGYIQTIQYIYLFVLISAMFTTAVANGYGVIDRMRNIFKIKSNYISSIIIILAMVVAQFGFSNMVGKIYPIFGYIGIFQIVIILLYFVVSKIKK